MLYTIPYIIFIAMFYNFVFTLFLRKIYSFYLIIKPNHSVQVGYNLCQYSEFVKKATKISWQWFQSHEAYL